MRWRYKNTITVRAFVSRNDKQMLKRTVYKRQLSYALAFPGQGVIENGLLANYSEYRSKLQRTLDTVDASLNERFTENLFDTNPDFNREWLLKTSNAQPAILVTSFVICKLMNKIFDLDIVHNASYLLGHSLGEYTALLLSGVLDLGTAVKLVRERGLLMEKLITSDEYGMLALMFRSNNFDRILDEARNYIANINSYQQIVLSGKRSDLENVVSSMNKKSKIVLKSVFLPVRIPFHSPMIRQIEPALTALLPTANRPCVPIISNLYGEPSVECLQNTIAVNSRPVQWVKSIEYLIKNDTDTIINIGPGSSLAGFSSKFKINTININSLDSIRAYGDFRRKK
ncbi:uncharacterized protein PRCAT00000464001 [Priceomyces carsonii]|uniref:uncharacterized protein n=1 Tax=Priceomyces carsonii TaxID=28549 RepID=UPI002EDAF4A5|nr:unnamed protein product [Priceomyces carsonii]